MVKRPKGSIQNGGGKVTYRLSAMSIKQVYRVERGFFGSWNYKNRKLANSSSFVDTKIFKEKLDVRMIRSNRNEFYEN